MAREKRERSQSEGNLTASLSMRLAANRKVHDEEMSKVAIVVGCSWKACFFVLDKPRMTLVV
mgnify:CR=1 FL=1